VDVGGAIGSVLLLGVDDEVTYNWFHNGRGTQGLDSSADGWRMVRDGYREVLLLVMRGLSESKAAWTGVAADAAHGAVSPVRAWVEQALDSAVQAQATVIAQSSAFSDIKARLSPPVTVPDKPWWNDAWPGDTNYDKALQAKQANSIRNVELVRQYGDLTQANGASYPRFEEPVVVTTDVARPPNGPVRPPDAGPVERPVPSGRKPAAGGDSPPASPTSEPHPPAQSGPPPIEAGPSPSQPGATVSSGHPTSPVTSSPVPTGQESPIGRTPVGGGPSAGLVGVPGPGVTGEPGSGGRIPSTRTGEPGGGGRNATGGRGPGGRPGVDGRFGGAPESEARTGRAAAPAGGRGGAGSAGGLVPPGGQSRGAEDEEHRNKFGPVDWHDEFWDDTPPVCPPVIGADEPQP
jgi:hypothetical protein